MPDVVPTTLPCMYCDDTLIFDPVRGWTHSNGQTYVGSCFCQKGTPHEALRAPDGAILCPTWRDHHAALPRRSD